MIDIERICYLPFFDEYYAFRYNHTKVPYTHLRKKFGEAVYIFEFAYQILLQTHTREWN